MPKAPLVLSFPGPGGILSWRIIFIVLGSPCNLSQAVSAVQTLKYLLIHFVTMRTYVCTNMFFLQYNIFQLDFRDNMLLNIQNGYGSYFLIHISLVLMMNTINTYFAINVVPLAVSYNYWYKIEELLGCLFLVV